MRPNEAVKATKPYQSSTGCIDATGQVRPHGANWATANNCTRYMCDDGEVQGLSFVCVAPPPSYGECSEFSEPGKCCPRYFCASPPGNGGEGLAAGAGGGRRKKEMVIR